METNKVEELSERLDRLEKENRQLRREMRRYKRYGIVASTAIFAVVGIVGADLPNLNTERIVIRSPNGGNVRMELSATNSGSQIYMYDATNKPRIVLGSGDKGTALWIDGKVVP